nr:uncharacterized protein si:ch211-107e6.5 isoform X2 [Misgurnus anguillicaudatus]XP_055048971.1 uncharacterized protein si:ch211-107e6.5 isoform X2 [Misgurnus anguillicaudatus]XP_055048972.1 uncharacterized protein si:ch211-107e6.5 isoform X2 [Misgurnus anguillicaudatus]XP_055048973.1 uncharacterized protein si:ch211-107e6.5 isoform X2 [Misgurnus anguillicaudatus]
MSTEMDEQDNVFKKQEVIESPPSTFNSKMLVNLEKRDLAPPISSPRPFFRLRINLPGSSQQDLKPDRFANDHRALVQTSSVIHPFAEEHHHHQESCCTDAQESSRQTENRMFETPIRSKTKFTDIENKEPKSPLLQSEQSHFRRAIRFIIILFIIFSIFYIILIGSQYVYLDLKGIARSLDLGIPKLRFTRKCSPPI